MGFSSFSAVVIDDFAGTSRALALVRGPGGAIVVASLRGANLQDAHRLADLAAREAAARLNAGQCLAEWDAAIVAKEEAEAATGDTLDDMRVLAGIPTNNPLGRYLEARAALRSALGRSAPEGSHA
jgi:hypothetical protein